MKKFVNYEKVFGILVVLFLTVSCLTACGGNNSSQKDESDNITTEQDTVPNTIQNQSINEERDFSKIKLGHVTEPLGDRGQMDAIKRGLDRFIEETDCEYSMVEANSPEDFVQGARNFAQSGYDIVVITLSIDALVAEFASDFPDTYFLINFGLTFDVPNIISVDMRQEQMAFLCGAFNAMMNTELGEINRSAMVAAMRGALDPAVYGFMAGSKWVGNEPTIGYAGEFNDPAKGKEFALQLYNEELRVVWGFAGQTGQGVFSAADSMPEGYYCMGGADGQFDLSDRMIASTVQDNAYAYYTFVWQIARGELTGGSAEISMRGGTADFQISPLHDFEDKVPQHIKDKIDELREKVINKEINPPANEEEYDAFLKEHNL